MQLLYLNDAERVAKLTFINEQLEKERDELKVENFDVLSMAFRMTDSTRRERKSKQRMGRSD